MSDDFQLPDNFLDDLDDIEDSLELEGKDNENGNESDGDADTDPEDEDDDEDSDDDGGFLLSDSHHAHGQLGSDSPGFRHHTKHNKHVPASQCGHVFVFQGDLNVLACDDWLLPCDATFNFSSAWQWCEEQEFPWKKEVPGWPTERQTWRPEVWFKDRVKPTMVLTGGVEMDEMLENLFTYFTETHERLKDQPPAYRRHKHLIAIPVVGTGYGGHQQSTGTVLSCIYPVMFHAAELYNIDLALVCYDKDMFNAAQVARSDTRFQHQWEVLKDSTQHLAEELAEYAMKKELVLFVGSGVSVGAGLPDWWGLLRDIAAEANMSEEQYGKFGWPMNPLDCARLIETKLGRDIGPIIAEQLKIPLCSPQHFLLATLPVAEVITTNYDDCFERASRKTHTSTAVLPYESDIDCSRWILKMHGCVHHPEDIVLTRSDYIRYAQRRGALAGITQTLLMTKHMLFAGFSLNDDNFLKIMDTVKQSFSEANAEPCDSESGASSSSSSSTSSSSTSSCYDGKFGSTITLSQDPMFENLWMDDLNIECTAVEGEPFGGGIWRLEIFYDLLNWHISSHSTRYVLSPKYEGVLSSGERKVVGALSKFVAALAQEYPRAVESAQWPQVAQFLINHGGAHVLSYLPDTSGFEDTTNFSSAGSSLLAGSTSTVSEHSPSIEAGSGMVYIVKSDIRRLSCDAILIPCSEEMVNAEWFMEETGIRDLILTGKAHVPAKALDENNMLHLDGSVEGDLHRILDHSEESALVFVVDIGQKFISAQFLADLVGKFLDEVAKDFQENDIHPRNNRHRPLITLPIIGTGWGEGAKNTGNVVRALLSVMYEKSVQYNMDLALVTNQHNAYLAAHIERLSIVDSPWADLDDFQKSEGKRLAYLAGKGQLAMMIGAGVAADAGLVPWGALLCDYATENGIKESYVHSLIHRFGSLDASRIIEQKCGDRASLVDYLVKRTSEKQFYTLKHAFLASLPIDQIISTNHDDLFELACDAGKHPVAVLQNEPVHTPRWLLNLYGTVSRPDNVILLTRDDMEESNRVRMALSGILQTQLITKHLLCVGFGLDNDKFFSLAHTVRNSVKGMEEHEFGTALVTIEDEMLEEAWKGSLKLIPMNKAATDVDVESERAEPEHMHSQHLNDDVTKAARIMDIFLDYVNTQMLLESSDQTYLMDDWFEGILSQPDIHLKNSLKVLRESLPNQVNAPVVKEVEDLLKSFGDDTESVFKYRKKLSRRMSQLTFSEMAF